MSSIRPLSSFFIKDTDNSSEDVTVAVDINYSKDDVLKLKTRRERGVFFTKGGERVRRKGVHPLEIEASSLSEKVYDLYKPNVVIEPYVGAGSLIKDLMFTRSESHTDSVDLRGVVNDINESFIADLKNSYDGFRVKGKSVVSKWKFTNNDVVKIPLKDLLEIWGLVSYPHDSPLFGVKILERHPLFITNPPWGTVTTNHLVSKKGELDGKSRFIDIDYGGMDRQYGRGDLLLPATAKLIEICRYLGGGVIAIFLPLGVFCGRLRYLRLLKHFLRWFVPVNNLNYIFSGSHFNGLANEKAVSFTVWRYRTKSEREKVAGVPLSELLMGLTFNYFNEMDEKYHVVGFKIAPLLKDYWHYTGNDDRCPYQNKGVKKSLSVVQGPLVSISEKEVLKDGCTSILCVSAGERFNANVPQIFYKNGDEGKQYPRNNGVKVCRHSFKGDGSPMRSDGSFLCISRGDMFGVPVPQFFYKSENSSSSYGTKMCRHGLRENSDSVSFLGTIHNESFNAPLAKIFYASGDDPTRGSKVCSHNIKDSVVKDTSGYSDILAFFIAIWSSTIGKSSITTYPLYIDNAYVHLPNFSDREIQKIVALSLMSNIIFQVKYRDRYTKGMIGFEKTDGEYKLRFSDDTGCVDYSLLAYSFIEEYRDLLIEDGEDGSGNISLFDVYEFVRDNCDAISESEDKKSEPLLTVNRYNRLVRRSIQERLFTVKYFDSYIPINNF